MCGAVQWLLKPSCLPLCADLFFEIVPAPLTWGCIVFIFSALLKLQLSDLSQPIQSDKLLSFQS